MRVRKWIASTVLSGGLLLGVGGPLASSAGAQPVVTGGLVNVTVTNLLNNNQVAVQIPINAAANVCGVNVVVLAQELASGPVTCEARSGRQELTITQIP